MDTNHFEVPESSVVETDLGAIEYTVVGEGKPILAFHGGGGGYTMSVLTYDMFSRAGFSLICPSRPGHLRTPLSSGEGIADQADLAAALLDELGVGRAGVVGASAGGPITYQFAIRHPEKTAAIVVIDGISKQYIWKPVGKIAQKLFLSDAGQRFQLMLAEHIPKTATREILKLEGDLTPAELKERVTHIVEDPVKLGYIMKFYQSMYPYSEREEGMWNDPKTESEIGEYDFDRISCPALILHGDRDSDVVFEHAEHAASKIPGAELYVIEGGTHFGFWLSDHADSAQRRAIDFFEKHLGQ